MARQQDYFDWIESQGTTTVGRGLSKMPTRLGPVTIGDEVIDVDSLTWEERTERCLEAAGRMVDSGLVREMGYGKRPLSNIEMYWLIQYYASSVQMLAAKWVVELFKWLERKDVNRTGEDKDSYPRSTQEAWEYIAGQQGEDF